MEAQLNVNSILTSKNAQIIKNKDKNENIINTNANIDTKVSIDTFNIQNNGKHDLLN